MKTIKKKLKYSCYCCNKSIKGKTENCKKCKDCNNTSYFKDNIYYFIVEKNGKKYCFMGDNLS